MASSDFPDDLVTAQLHLHQAWADLEALGRTLPWSAVPMEGYTSAHRTIDPGTGELRNKVFADSPGYTDEQVQQLAALRARIYELSETVRTHPHWETVDKGDLVAARSARLHSAARARAAG